MLRVRYRWGIGVRPREPWAVVLRDESLVQAEGLLERKKYDEKVRIFLEASRVALASVESSGARTQRAD